MDLDATAVAGDIEHPVFKAACGVISSSGDDRIIDEEGRRALAFSLLRHRLDPTLPEGVLAVIGLAAVLAEQGDRGAGAAILEVLATVRPHLDALRSPPASRQDFDKLLGTEPSVNETPGRGERLLDLLLSERSRKR